jgi:U3 small nucleolar RNA-associated protein 3
MARGAEEDYGLDEVDAFHAEQDKILLDQGFKRKHRDESSDEEVMDIDSDSGSDDEAEYFGKKYPEEEIDSEEEGAWGDKKSNYYGADNLEDEATAKQIEQEALRQQKKHLEQLNMDDYVDEEMEQEWTKTAKSHDFGDMLKEDEKAQQLLSDLARLDSKSKRKYLATSHPEFIPLVKELTKWKPVLESLQEDHDKEVLDVKFIALSAYLGAITSYLALFLALSKEDEPFTMKEHPVMEAILSTKEVWRQANDLELYEEEEEEEQEGESSDNEAYDSASENVSDIPQEDSQSEIEEEEEKESSDSELDIDVSKPRILKKVTPASITEDFAEGVIAEVDAEEKKTRKKTLRFYTSKIDQQSRKRDEKFSGDQDLPYKERLFERQQRLIEEARQRGLEQDRGAELDDYESDQEIPTNRERNDLDDSLYQSIKSSKDTSKAMRREVHDMAVRAAKEGRLAELKETVGEDGKRAVNYQILKNKGLTPHRNKDNRNSRVKKRKKYEKAQKKLKSVRAVYEQPKGAYEGEKTGIKKNLSKSVKF